MALFCSSLVVQLFKLTMNSKLFIVEFIFWIFWFKYDARHTHLSKWSTPSCYWRMYNCYKTSIMFMAFLWTVSNIFLVNIENHFHYRYCATYPRKICYNWWCIFIVSNMIGNHIFLWLEPRNSIACHQTLVQILGTKLILVYTTCTTCLTNHTGFISRHMTPLVIINSLGVDTQNVQHMPLQNTSTLWYYLHYQFPPSWGYLANIN